MGKATLAGSPASSALASAAWKPLGSWIRWMTVTNMGSPVDSLALPVRPEEGSGHPAHLADVTVHTQVLTERRVSERATAETCPRITSQLAVRWTWSRHLNRFG